MCIMVAKEIFKCLFPIKSFAKNSWEIVDDVIWWNWSHPGRYLNHFLAIFQKVSMCPTLDSLATHPCIYCSDMSCIAQGNGKLN